MRLPIIDADGHVMEPWPDPILLLRDRADLTDAQKRACFVDGAAQFFGIDVDGVLAHLGDGWSLDADLGTIAGMLPSTTPSVPT